MDCTRNRARSALGCCLRPHAHAGTPVQMILYLLPASPAYPYRPHVHRGSKSSTFVRRVEHSLTPPLAQHWGDQSIPAAQIPY
jgi:hypothetical protein